MRARLTAALDAPDAPAAADAPVVTEVETARAA
jgi:hypothetical protein